MADNSTVYRFSRGAKYSCLVAVVNNGEHITFSDVVYPVNTPEDVVSRMLDDAEKEAIKAYNEEYESRWTTED